MWQDILAVDSKVSQLRPAMAQDKELRPLYLKRRLQLLQEQQRKLQPEVNSSNGGGPIRNKKYLSLRVKLLKRQFGIPSDVLSLRSLSLSGNPVSVDHLNDNVADARSIQAADRIEQRGVLCVHLLAVGDIGVGRCFVEIGPDLQLELRLIGRQLENLGVWRQVLERLIHDPALDPAPAAMVDQIR